MSSCRTERARKLIIGRDTDWIKNFKVGEYIQNIPLIEKLYEEKQLALVRVDDLEKQVKIVEVKLHTLELENQAKTIRLLELNKQSNFSFVLSLVATILVGIGVNVATSIPTDWIGWIMITAACIIEITAFLIKPTGSKEADG